MKRLLDSVILIDHLNSVSAATEYLGKIETAQTSISVITRAEILTGVKKNVSTVKLLLDQFILLGIDREIADRAAELRQTHRWKLPDAFQAALAIRYGIEFVTRNTKDFGEDRHTFVKIPYRVI